MSFLNLYIVYELNNRSRNPSNNFNLKNCSFGTAKLTRNAIKTKFEELILMERVNGVM